MSQFLNNTASTKGFVAFPSQLHWSAQDIADAVPLRLFELDLFDPDNALPSANHGAVRVARASYLSAAPNLFRIRG